MNKNSSLIGVFVCCCFLCVIPYLNNSLCLKNQGDFFFLISKPGVVSKYIYIYISVCSVCTSDFVSSGWYPVSGIVESNKVNRF